MYLIDGNNVIGGRVGWHRDKKGSRRRLVQDLARLAHVKKTRLTVVFDGAPDNSFPDGSSFRGVKIFYAHQGSDADTRILEMVEAERNRKNLTVVTSDGKLAGSVRVRGVRVMRSGEFRRILDQSIDALPPGGATDVEANEMAEWLRYFGVEEDGASVGRDADHSREID